MHLIWSALVVVVLNLYYDHRLINVRKAKNVGTEWEDMSSAFAETAIKNALKHGKPSAIFLGSSVTYGYPWQERVAFTKLVAEKLPDWQISNLSIVGAGMRALTDFATCSLTASHRPDVLIVEIPLVNSTSSISTNDPISGRKCANNFIHGLGYWQLTITRPYGLGWVSLLWDEESYEKGDSDLVITKLPSTYFATSERFNSIKSRYTSELEEHLSTISNMGNQVFAYISPIYTPAIEIAGGDRSAVEEQIGLSLEICKRNGRVICLDMSQFGTRRELFYNLTHLNQRGHRALGNWFEQQILQHGKGRPLETPPSFPH